MSERFFRPSQKMEQANPGPSELETTAEVLAERTSKLKEREVALDEFIDSEFGDPAPDLKETIQRLRSKEDY